MKFYEKLQQLRKEKGYSQEQLAEVLQVSRQAVSKWETGVTYPETDKLIQISNLFEVSVDILIKDNLELNSQKKQENDGEIENDNAQKQESEKEEKQEGNDRHNIKESAKKFTEDALHSAKEFGKGATSQVKEASKRVAKHAKSAGGKAYQSAKRFGSNAVRQFDPFKLVGNIILSALILGGAITLVVDYMLNGFFTWSLLVAGACVFTAFIVLPPFFLKAKGFFVSLVSLTVLLYPFLWLVQKVVNEYLPLIVPSNIMEHIPVYWLQSLGLYIPLVWLVIIWVGFIMWKLKLPTKIFILIFIPLLAIGDIATNSIVASFSSGPDYLSRNFLIQIGSVYINPLNLLVYLLILCGVFSIAFSKRRQAPAQENPYEPYE